MLLIVSMYASDCLTPSKPRLGHIYAYIPFTPSYSMKTTYNLHNTEKTDRLRVNPFTGVGADLSLTETSLAPSLGTRLHRNMNIILTPNIKELI